jgi:hypothetical protein
MLKKSLDIKKSSDIIIKYKDLEETFKKKGLKRMD